jgi:uncharacterized repeat protein (TIGR02543 family)
MGYKVFGAIMVVCIVALLPLACGPAQYKLNTAVIPEDAGTITPASGKYVAGTEVTITAIPASGYAFDRWEGDFTGSNVEVPIIATMDHDKTITAYFKPGYHLTVSISPSGGGMVSAAGGAYPVGGIYAYGVNELARLRAEANPGYCFDHWSGYLIDDTHTGIVIGMDQDWNVVAHFKEGICTSSGTGSTSSGSGSTISAVEAQQAVQTMLDIESRASTYIEGEPRPVLPNGVEIPKNGKAGTPTLVNVNGVPAWKVPVLTSNGVRIGEIYVKQIRSKPNRVDFITFGQYSPTGLETEYGTYR